MRFTMRDNPIPSDFIRFRHLNALILNETGYPRDWCRRQPAQNCQQVPEIVIVSDNPGHIGASGANRINELASGMQIACTAGAKSRPQSRDWRNVKGKAMSYPTTQEARRAGMAAFRAKMLATHERHANNPKLSDEDRAYQRELCATIRAAQVRFGEVQS